MPIYKGSQNQGLICKGSSVITNVYKGSTLVYRLAFDPVTFTESGTGGTQTAGGSVGGTFGFGGSSSGGHGGAGWYGGVAGQAGLVNKVGTCAAGGGGSSYTHRTLFRSRPYTRISKW